MPNISTERIQAPSGGMNSDASPDYVGATEAVSLVNMLPGQPGKAVMRGQIVTNIADMTAVGAAPTAFWAFDDFALVKGDVGTGVKTWRCSLSAATKTDVTAALVETPLDSRHARYGAYVYGAIDDAAAPQLGKWDGAASAIVPQANAPFQFTDLQVYAQRLFVLGGTVPGTTTPVINASRVLYWSDANPAADLSLAASWVDDVSGLTNELNYDGDDTPIGLAGCGRFMAIVGSRSINVLAGSGSSSFAIRNLTKNWGCLDIRTIVEVDDGFYFLSDRGFAYCDGTAVVSVSDDKVSAALAANRGQTHMAAVFNDGYLALQSLGVTWLYHVATRTWSQIAMENAGGTAATSGVFRTNTYPVLWQGGGLRRAELATRRGIIGVDYDGSLSAPIKSSWTSRFARLASPGQVAIVQRLLFEYSFKNADANGFRVRVLDTQGTELANQIVPAITTGRRQRFQVEVFAETDSVQLVVTNASSSANNIDAEIYDAYIEFIPAQVRATV